MIKYAIIVAGGSGTRFGGPLPKQFQELHGKSLLSHTVNAFSRAYKDLRFILVLPKGFEDKATEIRKSYKTHEFQIAQGGETRFVSVKSGLSFVKDESIVFVHDAVRCLVSPALIQRCYEAAAINGNAIPCITPHDSLRYEGQVIDRAKVKLIQTPQTFKSKELQEAFKQNYHESFTDEATVAENAGMKIHYVQGEETNIKITRPVDLFVAQQLLLY